MRQPGRTAALAVIAATAVAFALAGCSSPAARAPALASRPKGGIATVADIIGTGPNWIFPFAGLADDTSANYQDFMDLMYRPLYMFGGNNDSVAVNYPLSPANAPVYRDGGRAVSISLKGWRWSDGEKVDAADVIFWLNMDEAEKLNFAGYTKGDIPDNVLSYRAAGPDTVVLTLTRPYASTWFTYNELAQITPMPLAWDVVRTGAAPGSGGCERDTAADHWARCRAVYEFLTAQSRDTRTYASSSLWSVVDGPWRLKAFDIDGNLTLVPNPKYSGWPKPALAELRFVSYTGEQNSFDAVKASQVDVATIPSPDLLAKPPGRALPSTNPAGKGYYLQSADTFGINYYILDFQNRRDSAIFSQQYFRQALQELTNQGAIVTKAYNGYAIPTTAGVPNEPRSQWVTAAMTAHGGAGLYPYDPAAAESLLAAHGWSLVTGTLTCQRPGDLAGECGPGIAKGLTANLGAVANWQWTIAPQGQTMMIVQAGLASAGIHISLFDPGGLLGPAPCAAPWCEAAMAYVGGWVFNGPGYAPTGEPLFQTGASWNLGLYSSATMDSLISAVQTSNNVSVFRAYADYTATQLPVIWLPTPYSVVAVSTRLRGVTQSPLGSFYPEYWYFARPTRR